MSEFRRRLMMSIDNSSDMSISDAMEGMDIIFPSINAYSDGSAVLHNFEYGKSYHIIAKVGRGIPADKIMFFVYKGNSNTPNVDTGYFINAGETTVIEFTYTHEQIETYTRISVWATNSNDRNSYRPIIIYIEDL